MFSKKKPLHEEEHREEAMKVVSSFCRLCHKYEGICMASKPVATKPFEIGTCHAATMVYREVKRIFDKYDD